MSKAQKTLERLLDVLATDLLDRIEKGEATAADLNVARQMLKDNGINAIAKDDNPIGKLAQSLPFQSAEQIQEDPENFH